MKHATVGKYVLDSISIGMYNNPLMVLREYIQNSTDSIDEAVNCGVLNSNEASVEIHVDGNRRTLRVVDNGIGIRSSRAWSTLHDLGCSSKSRATNRGFRGIGRLGGIGYCEQLVMRTKHREENLVSQSTWDCGKLRSIINSREVGPNAARIVESVVEFKQFRHSGDSDEQFFVVELHGLRSSRDVLMHVPMIKNYVAQTAPVPFNGRVFKHASEIDTRLREHVASYETYDISVNGDRIYKPYADVVSLSRHQSDRIRKVDYVRLTENESLLAFGWLAQLEHLGVISIRQGIDGIRVRSGNILVGDKYLLADLFRERRFNNYLVGELHIVDRNLLLNSRRDDLEDNDYTAAFYNSFVKNVGLPYSLRIRQASIKRGNGKKNIREGELMQEARKIARRGYFSDVQKQHIIRRLINMKAQSEDGGNTLRRLIERVRKAGHYFDLNGKDFTRKERDTLRSIFDIIYRNSTDKGQADQVINKIIKRLTSKR